MLPLGLPASGCTCGDSAKPPAPASVASVVASASASSTASVAKPERPRRPTQPAPKPESFSASASDGVRIGASRWAAQGSAAAVLLVHRLGGDRSEWTPLVERLLPTKQPMHIVSFDLRGHGESTADPKKPKGKIGWQSFDQAAFEKMDADLEAVMATHAKGKETSWILVGSDLGGTLVVRQAASRKGDVVGVALVSPGAALRGIDLYKPFEHVAGHPNLLLAGTQDTVSDGPVKVLARMSPTSKLVTWEARGHGAQFLGEERWEMWDELADWVDARVRETLVGTPVDVPASSASAFPATPAPSVSARDGGEPGP